MEIRTLKPGDQVTAFYLIKALKVGEAKNGSKYLDLTLGDKTGEINAKLWNITPEDEQTYKASMIVKVQAVVETFKDKPQLKIDRMRPAQEEDGVSVRDFLKTAPADPTELVTFIKKTAESIQNNTLYAIVRFCLQKVGDRLLDYPAAKSNHHNYYAGLAYHTARMIQIAEFLCDQRPFLNRDLLIAGIIIHDIAKTEEYIAENGITAGFSIRGSLIGHINLAYGYIIEACYHYTLLDLNEEMVSKLQHLILSHHGQLDYGSPVKPQLPEAVALHHIDLIDSKLQAIEDALLDTPDDAEWTSPVRVVDGVRILKNWKQEANSQ